MKILILKYSMIKIVQNNDFRIIKRIMVTDNDVKIKYEIIYLFKKIKHYES